MRLRNNLPIFELAISAYRASHDFRNYLNGSELNVLSLNAKEVTLTHFLYPMLQIVDDQELRQEIQEEIQRIQSVMGGG